jgi:hypothetical protein
MNAAEQQGYQPERTGSPEQTQQTPEPEGTGGGSGCTTCDLAEIDTMTCTAKKFARQAAVMNEAAPNLDAYRTQYDDARAKYSAARTAALADLDAIRQVLDDLVEQLRCRLKDDDLECLERSCEEVFAKIDDCSEPPGCQSPCDDSDAAGMDTTDDLEALAAEIERRRRNLADSAAYFTALVAEPDDITAQVAKLRTMATDLAAKVEAGGDGSKVVEWYAAWLILDRSARWERLGRGFTSVSAYMDCLCSLLRCLVSGWTVLATLEGRKAELDCYETARKDACSKLKADVLQALLDTYEECCEKAASSQPPDDYGHGSGGAAGEAQSA